MRHAFETRDVPARSVRLAGAALVAGIVLALVLVAGMTIWLDSRLKRPSPSPGEIAPLQPPEPRLSAHPAADRAAVDARAEALLQGYGWIDRAAGRVRIPIDRAMRLTAEQGWPLEPPQDRSERK